MAAKITGARVLDNQNKMTPLSPFMIFICVCKNLNYYYHSCKGFSLRTCLVSVVYILMECMNFMYDLSDQRSMPIVVS